MFFPGESTMVKFHFTNSTLRERTFTNNAITVAKHQTLKSNGSRGSGVAKLSAARDPP